MFFPSKRGLSLLELAIALAVIGIVIGGIFMAAGAMMQRYRTTQVERQIQDTVKNVRSVFAAKSSFSLNGLTPYQFAFNNNIFPDDVVDSSTNFINAFGGAIAIGAGPDAQSFTVTAAKLPRAACISVVMHSLASKADQKRLGVFGFETGTGNSAISGVKTDGMGGINATMNNSLNFLCQDASNDITIYFALRKPAGS